MVPPLIPRCFHRALVLSLPKHPNHRDPDRDLIGEERGEDFLIVRHNRGLERSQIRIQINESSSSLYTSSHGPMIKDNMTKFLKRSISVDNFGVHLELADRYVRSVLGKCGMSQANAIATQRQAATKLRQQPHKRSWKQEPQSCT